MLHATPDGLFCEGGPFHVDPAGSVDLAMVTHAHADHARPGSARYVCATPGVPVLRRRLGPDARDRRLGVRRGARIGGVDVSLHPAGHVLGSAQVRVHDGHETWVVSGDFKRQPDPTCAPFEVVPCDTFVSEATFALPVYRWPPVETVRRRTARVDRGATARRRPPQHRAVRVQPRQGAARAGAAGDALDQPALVHGAVAGMTEAYRESGVDAAAGRAGRRRRPAAPPLAGAW